MPSDPQTKTDGPVDPVLQPGATTPDAANTDEKGSNGADGTVTDAGQNTDSVTRNGTPTTEIKVQLTPPAESKNLDAKIAVPWGLAVIGTVTTIILFVKNRTNKVCDDCNDIAVEDLKDFLAKIEELAQLIATHQSGCPCNGNTLKESREHLTNLRKSAQATSARVEHNFQNDAHQKEWKENYRTWKNATEGNTGWITNKKNCWSYDDRKILDEANENYIGYIVKTRNQVARRKIKLRE